MTLGAYNTIHPSIVRELHKSAALDGWVDIVSVESFRTRRRMWNVLQLSGLVQTRPKDDWLKLVIGIGIPPSSDDRPDDRCLASHTIRRFPNVQFDAIALETARSLRSDTNTLKGNSSVRVVRKYASLLQLIALLTRRGQSVACLGDAVQWEQPCQGQGARLHLMYRVGVLSYFPYIIKPLVAVWYKVNTVTFFSLGFVSYFVSSWDRFTTTIWRLASACLPFTFFSINWSRC